MEGATPRRFLKKSRALAKDVLACETEAVEVINTGEKRANAEHVRWEAMKDKWREEELEGRQKKAREESRIELESLFARSEKWERLDRPIAMFTKWSVDVSDENKARLPILIKAIESLEGPRPTLDDFLAWKAPHERT